MWFKRKRAAPSDGASSHPPIPSEVARVRDDSIEAVLSRAQEMLYHNGPALAVEYLGRSPFANSKPVIRKLQSLVWTHRHAMPEELLEEPFLDPIFCECSACGQNWLMPPMVSNFSYSGPSAGVRCSSCYRVFCSECALPYERCPCGGLCRRLRQPNGRSYRIPQAELPEPDWLSLHLPDRSLEYPQEMHLYFGLEGKIPIGVDPTFPLVKVAPTYCYLKWAEILADAGIYYQAQQHLDILQEPDASFARALWLRARLALVQYHNGRERSKRYMDFRDTSCNWRELPGKIRLWLDKALQREPEFGPAWLTRAQVYLDPALGQDFECAFRCAEQARTLLGDTPAVLLALGQALRGVGSVSEAVVVLHKIPTEAEENEQARRELEIAELEARCQSEPGDVEAHLRLGRWYFRHHQHDRAQEIFTQLVDQHPNHAEGYYGLALLARADIGIPARLSKVHHLCRRALELNPNFGLAYELLADIFHDLHSTKEEVGFQVGDPLEYARRALELDPDCDEALCLLAEDYINQGQLQPALQRLERAAQLDTNNSLVYRILAVIHTANRQFEERNLALRKAAELDPGMQLSGEYEAKILRLCKFRY